MQCSPSLGIRFNPARSLDPAIYNLDFSDMWIYIFAPLLGGMIGGAIRVLFGPAPAHEAAAIRATGGLPQGAGEANPEVPPTSDGRGAADESRVAGAQPAAQLDVLRGRWNGRYS